MFFSQGSKGPIHVFGKRTFRRAALIASRADCQRPVRPISGRSQSLRWMAVSGRLPSVTFPDTGLPGVQEAANQYGQAPAGRKRTAQAAPERLVFPVVRGNGDDGGLVRSVAPGVVGAPLYHDFPCLQLHLLRIQRQRDLAFEDAAEIERARFLHVGVRRPRRVGRSARRAHVAEERFHEKRSGCPTACGGEE